MTRPKRKIVTEEVSNDEVTPRRKPRKKQAVTKTNSAAVKALIRKNATNSPLLLFSSEVRENILCHLVGDKLIHLKYLDVGDYYQASKAKNEHLGIGGSESNGPRPWPSAFSQFINDDSDMNVGDSDAGDEGETATCKAEPSSPADGPATSSSRAEIPPMQTSFCHAICTADQSEQSAFKEVMSGSSVVPKDESPEFYVPSCKARHANCKMCGDGPMFLLDEDLQALRVDLTVLGVCRQLYEEANHLLWATNTFSFEDPKTFIKFFNSLNPAQKHNLTSIHINTVVGRNGSLSFANSTQRARWDCDYWGSALKLTNLNMLRGVRALHLCINQGFNTFGHTHASQKEAFEEAQKADMDFILRLRALSLKHVTVIVSDDAETMEASGTSSFRWTAKKKNEYADGIRLQLMDAAGAEVVKTEVEAANHARKIEIRDNAFTRLEWVKDSLKSRRAEVVRATTWASHQEAKASSLDDKASLKMEKALKIKSKKKAINKATELQHAADRQRDKAVNAREAADAALERVKYYQGFVDSAREKHRRALVRLGATPEDIQIENETEELLDGIHGSDKEDALVQPKYEESGPEDEELSS